MEESCKKIAETCGVVPSLSVSLYSKTCITDEISISLKEDKQLLKKNFLVLWSLNINYAVFGLCRNGLKSSILNLFFQTQGKIATYDYFLIIILFYLKPSQTFKDWRSAIEQFCSYLTENKFCAHYKDQSVNVAYGTNRLTVTWNTNTLRGKLRNFWMM